MTHLTECTASVQAQTLIGMNLDQEAEELIPDDELQAKLQSAMEPVTAANIEKIQRVRAMTAFGLNSLSKKQKLQSLTSTLKAAGSGTPTQETEELTLTMLPKTDKPAETSVSDEQMRMDAAAAFRLALIMTQRCMGGDVSLQRAAVQQAQIIIDQMKTVGMSTTDVVTAQDTLDKQQQKAATNNKQQTTTNNNNDKDMRTTTTANSPVWQ